MLLLILPPPVHCSTRLFKEIDEEGKVRGVGPLCSHLSLLLSYCFPRYLQTHYTIRVASAETKAPEIIPGSDGKTTFHLVYGDYQPLMRRIVENLERAKEFAANPTQKSMLEGYIKR